MYKYITEFEEDKGNFKKGSFLIQVSFENYIHFTKDNFVGLKKTGIYKSQPQKYIIGKKINSKRIQWINVVDDFETEYDGIKHSKYFRGLIKDLKKLEKKLNR